MDFTQSDYELINKEFEELRLAALKRCSSQEEYDGVLKAFDFANEAHKGVRRRSGEPYIIHPISVAKIVVNEIGLGYKSIVAALLHDVVEDTEYTVDDIKRLFGEKIASLVDGLTKIKAAMDTDGGGNLQAENFKRIILTLNDDVRVVLIKLADRLHNIRTIDSMPDYKKDKILSETMYLFVPLAHRLGLYNIKSEMENIWLKTRNPKAYNDIVSRIDGVIKEKGEAMDKFIQPVADALQNAGYTFEITKKTPYSVWHKMQEKHVEFEDIYDIYGIRIIFTPKPDEDERTQCWYIYSLVSGIYTSKTDRIRDWVTRPKSNGYEALHCTVMSNGGGWVEVQIRSERMNEIAEKGIAAHWSYKQKGEETNSEKEMDRWLDMVREVLENPDSNALKFLDKFHDTLLDQEIYVFTPKGESKSLPKGSTALDFAYSIHSQIGNKAIAAKINFKLSPLSKVLRNGDQVEIITAESQKPQPEWLDFLRTSRARNYVYEALKDDVDDSIKSGRQILEKELGGYGVKLQSNVLKKLLREYSVNTKEELYNKISTGVISLKDLDKVLRKNTENKNVIYWTLKLFRSNKKSSTEDSGDEEENGNDEMTNAEIRDRIIKNQLDKNRDLILDGEGKGEGKNPDAPVTYRIADCCYPIPGDTIVGFINDSGEVVVHKKTCPEAVNLASIHGDRIVNAKWSKNTVASFLARIKIFGTDRLGILNELTKVTTLVLNINMRKVYIATHDSIFEGYIDCYVRSTEDLDNLMAHIRKIKGVESVNRVDIKDNK